VRSQRSTELGLTHPTKETGFFYENTLPRPTDSLKNPVSGAPCVSPMSIEIIWPERVYIICW